MWCCSFFLSMYCLFLPCAANRDKQRQPEPRGTESLPPSGATTHCINTHIHTRAHVQPALLMLPGVCCTAHPCQSETHTLYLLHDWSAFSSYSRHSALSISVTYALLCIINSLIQSQKKYCGGDMHNIIGTMSVISQKYILEILFFLFISI